MYVSKKLNPFLQEKSLNLMSRVEEWLRPLLLGLSLKVRLKSGKGLVVMVFSASKKTLVHFGILNSLQKWDLEANVDVEDLEAEVEALEVILEEEKVMEEGEESITTTTTTNIRLFSLPLSLTHTHTH